jgi:hypothetical protein
MPRRGVLVPLLGVRGELLRRARRQALARALLRARNALLGDAADDDAFFLPPR